MTGLNRTSLSTAVTYSPPGHHGVTAHRLQGAEAGGPPGFWVGHSHYPPGAGADLGPVSGDTVYLVLEGELVVSTQDADDESQTLLETGDSAYLPQGTVRSVTNAGHLAARLLVIAQPAEASR